MCVPTSVPSYSVAIGLILYAAIYLYLLFYHNNYVYVFNKFAIYIIGVDLLVSAFYHFSTNDSNDIKPPDAHQNLNYSSNFGQQPVIDMFDDDINIDTDSNITDSEDVSETDTLLPDAQDTNTNALYDYELQEDELQEDELQEPQQNVPELIEDESSEEHFTPQPNELLVETTDQPKRKRGRPPKQLKD